MDGKKSSTGQQAQEARPDVQKRTADSDTGNVTPVNGHERVDMNMEAAISADDVMRAGGFGAKDDIGSLLPTAMDCTDFEASLRDARDFEGEQEQPSHPGLGYSATEVEGGTKPLDVPRQ
ncbi:unnamed protein product [Alopecurus aequalis]